MQNNHHNAWLNERGQLILMFAGVAGLLFLMFKLDHLFNPLAYGLMVGIVLYPIRQQPVTRALLYATAFATVIWLIHDSGHLLIPFVFAFIIAFLLNPLVSKMEQRDISRRLLATMFTIVSMSLIVLVIIFATPVLLQQITRVAGFLSQAANDATILVEQSGVLALTEQIGLDNQLVKTQIIDKSEAYLQLFFDNLSRFSSEHFVGLSNFFIVLFFMILTPFLCFFMIRDYEKVSSFLSYLVTPQGVDVNYASQIGSVVGDYIRGQFIVVIISMVNLSLGFYIIGLPNALLLGVLAGLTNFIPTFGLWLSITVTTLVGISAGNPWYQFLPGIYIVFAIEQVLETGFIVPRVVGKHVGLHPLLVMLSLLVFGFMFGLLGLLIAVPTVALISILIEQYKKTRKISFLEGSELDNFIQQFERKSSGDTSIEELNTQTDPID